MENFSTRHGETRLATTTTGLTGIGADGSTFTLTLPWNRTYAGPATVEGIQGAAGPPTDWGVLLVRRGGFAVARLSGTTLVASKVGSRHVQGRTKAGGQSQQRFARRRDNQARVAYDAAAGHAGVVLGDVPLLVLGGDRAGLDHVLARQEFRHMECVGPVLEVPGDPRRKELEAAVGHAGALRITVVNR